MSTSWYDNTINLGHDHDLLEKFKQLTLPANKVIAEYVWIEPREKKFRTKTKVLSISEVSDLKDIEITYTDVQNSVDPEKPEIEVKLIPVKYIKDPFRKGNNIIVLCEMMTYDGTPVLGNQRALARSIFEDLKVKEAEPWFGIEQEFMLFTPDMGKPLGFHMLGQPIRTKGFYCAVGTETIYGRHISEAHLWACLYCGLHISGTNSEAMAGQWEYQIGPIGGIDAGDEIWLSRFILEKICEEYGVAVSFHPKMLKDWNGSGCHCNFSTKKMRQENGINYIEKACLLLEPKHKEHMKVYGKDNELRLTGDGDTASYDHFTYGIGNRKCSVRVTRATQENKSGYLEDRRPGANCDPYEVCSMLAKTCIMETAEIL